MGIGSTEKTATSPAQVAKVQIASAKSDFDTTLLARADINATKST